MSAMKAKRAHLSVEIMGGKGAYGVSNSVELAFAGNCGEKWRALVWGGESDRGGLLRGTIEETQAVFHDRPLAAEIGRWEH
jgi:hypothetical protein